MSPKYQKFLLQKRRNRIQNNVNTNNNNNSSPCCICDRDCIIPICKIIFKVIAIVITPIIIFIVCIMANIATLVYLVAIFLACIYLNNGKGEDFYDAPHKYFLHPWKWLCDAIEDIKRM